MSKVILTREVKGELPTAVHMQNLDFLGGGKGGRDGETLLYLRCGGP